MNNRKQIRDAIFARLDNQLELDSEKIPIYNNRSLPVKKRPVVNIFTSGDTSEKTPDEQANRREENVEIQVYVEGKEEHEIIESGVIPVADKLEDVILQIETIFNKQIETLGEVVFRLNYEGTEMSIFSDGNTVIAVAILDYVAKVNEQLEGF